MTSATVVFGAPHFLAASHSLVAQWPLRAHTLILITGQVLPVSPTADTDILNPSPQTQSSPVPFSPGQAPSCLSLGSI